MKRLIVLISLISMLVGSAFANPKIDAKLIESFVNDDGQWEDIEYMCNGLSTEEKFQFETSLAYIILRETMFSLFGEVDEGVFVERDMTFSFLDGLTASEVVEYTKRTSLDGYMEYLEDLKNPKN